MYLLHIETSTVNCSVALSYGETILAGRMAAEMNHTALLAPMIAEVMEEASLSMEALDGVVVSLGPGSYTGLRVGIATAKAIAYSQEIPLIPISTLYMLAHAAKTAHPGENVYLMPMIDARRMEVYCSLYDNELESIWPEGAVILDESFLQKASALGHPILACGDGAVKLRSLPGSLDSIAIDESINCEARHLVIPGLAAMKRGQHGDVMHLTPTYVKAPNITSPKKPSGL